jgi:hypothetical protein
MRYFRRCRLRALRSAKVDFVLPATAIASKILELVREPWKDKAVAVKPGIRTPEGEKMSEELDERLSGTPSVFTCPDCKRNDRASADRFSDIAAGRQAQADTMRGMLLSQQKTQ